MSISHRRIRSDDPRNLAARLKHRVTFQEAVFSGDDVGGRQTEWSPVATVWAELRSRSAGAGESLFAGKIQAESTHILTLRYRNDIRTDMRVSYNNRLFNIRHVDNIDAANVMLELLLEEGVAH